MFTLSLSLFVSISANLIWSWFMLRGNALHVTLFGVIGGVAGWFLLTWLEGLPASACLANPKNRAVRSNG